MSRSSAPLGRSAAPARRRARSATVFISRRTPVTMAPAGLDLLVEVGAVVQRGQQRVVVLQGALDAGLGLVQVVHAGGDAVG